jgi:histidinol-phosphate aminotransferase
MLTNPGNPTSTMIAMAEIERLAEGIPPKSLLVIDSAYAEYAGDYDGGARLVGMRDNVVMTRTFSKIYGLGGMRVGWGYAPCDIIDVLNRVRQPFNLSTVALAAAEAAVRDQAWVQKCREENARLRAWLAEALAGYGVPSDTSMTNFVLARFGSAEEAAACNDYLLSQGVIVRAVSGYGLPEALRITVGDEASCRRAAHCIGQFKEGAA